MEIPNNEKELFEDYQIISVSGQQAISVDGGLWFIFNTPNNEHRINISVILDVQSGAKSLYDEMDKVIKSFSFTEE